MDTMLDKLLAQLDSLHAQARSIRFLHWYTWFVRIMLALAFLPSGYTKLMNEPFMRPDSSPGPVLDMFNALYQDFGFLYQFIGISQLTAAALLLIPRTAALGAAIYLPLITGIVVLTVSLDFHGTPVITCLMLLGTIYLLCWDWHRFRGVLTHPVPLASAVTHDERP